MIWIVGIVCLVVGLVLGIGAGLSIFSIFGGDQ